MGARWDQGECRGPLVHQDTLDSDGAGRLVKVRGDTREGRRCYLVRIFYFIFCPDNVVAIGITGTHGYLKYRACLTF